MSRSALLAVLALAPLVSGCIAVAAAGVVGVGIVQYRRNEAEQDFPNDLQVTWRATLEGLRRLEVVPAEEACELGATEGRIAHEDLVVVVERHPEGFSRVRVRVGAFHTDDNERRARLVLQEIGTLLEQKDELRAWSEKVRGLPQSDQGEPQPE